MIFWDHFRQLKICRYYDYHDLFKQVCMNWQILQGSKFGRVRRWTHSSKSFLILIKHYNYNATRLDCNSCCRTLTDLWSQFPINNQFPVRILHTALQYSLKVPRCLWATGKVVTIIAGYSFLLHKASCLCKWCWAVGLSLPCSRSPLIQFFFPVCQPVLQALTAWKPALESLLEQYKLSGEWEKVRAGLGIELYLTACWGKRKSDLGQGKWKQSRALVQLFAAMGTWAALEPSVQIKMKVVQYHGRIWLDFFNQSWMSDISE